MNLFSRSETKKFVPFLDILSWLEVTLGCAGSAGTQKRKPLALLLHLAFFPFVWDWKNGVHNALAPMLRPSRTSEFTMPIEEILLSIFLDDFLHKIDHPLFENVGLLERQLA